MTRVLLTGGSGFIAAHILEILLQHGHSVVTTVRSQAKADKIKEAHPQAGKNLDFAIVEDIAQPQAFAKAVVSDPPFEAVIHTASPFHFNAKDIQKDLLDPAVNGTRGVLEAIKEKVPSVKRVVITSSFAAILNPYKGNWPEHTYSEQDWSPLDNAKAASENNIFGYRGSKTMAEKAAWEFVDKEKPGFDLVTMNPPMVLGPITHYLNSLDSLNTSNQTVRDLITGKHAAGPIPGGAMGWIDVRDLALLHVKTMELPSAGSKRYFATAGHFTTAQVTDIIRTNFPALKDKLPKEGAEGGQFPEGGIWKVDNSRTKEVLGKFTSLEDSICDLVRSLQAAGA